MEIYWNTVNIDVKVDLLKKKVKSENQGDSKRKFNAKILVKEDLQSESGRGRISQ